MIISVDEVRQIKEIIKEVKEKINNFDVFKEFTFPLMKRDEEKQVKSSIDYEWRKSIKEPLLKIPIITVEKEKENDLINLVDSILDLNKELINQSNQNKEKIIETQIELTNNKSNQLVFELYDLSADEIKIIENSLNE